MKPLCIDLYCGLGGWTEGFLAAGYDVIGFDIERHVYGDQQYPAQLVLQDVLTLDGRQFKDAACIVASSPCQRYSYMHMPWTRAKALADWYRDPAHPERMESLNALFLAPQRIQREAIAAAGRWIPLVQENVIGAQRWVGRARWHYGSYYLWGDVPALMPISLRGEAAKVPGENWNHFHQTGATSYFNVAAEREIKNSGGSWFNVAHNQRTGNNARDVLAAELSGQKTTGHVNRRNGAAHTSHLTNQAEHDLAGTKGFTPDGGPLGKNEVGKRSSSKSQARKAASARIAKIPFTLAYHIALCYASTP